MFTLGVPTYNTLKEIGVHRSSLASGFSKHTPFSMKHTAGYFLNEDGLEDFIQNMVTSNYLNSLIVDK
ncbi:MAG: hypothetical protein H3C71_03850 [Flavobacteriales bacterium]|nr:hypothetical protein [Flavobacteriales bacterium]